MVGNGNGNNRNLTYDIMINIMKRLPVKSLIRFKCVSKDWSRLFQTPHFIALHLHHSSHNNPFLLLQRIPHSSSCLIGPNFKVRNPQFIDFPSPAAKIIGSCNDLLCVRDTNHHMLSILNPATKEVRQAATRDPDPEVVASFNIGREMFTLLKGPPPPSPNTHSRTNVLAVYNNKLAMFHHFIIGSFESSSIDLWVLEEESWVKQYVVGPLLKVLYPLSIWRDETVCREQFPPGKIDDDEYIGVETVLSIFNPYSNELKKLPAQRDEHYYVSFNYAESLFPISNTHLQH